MKKKPAYPPVQTYSHTTEIVDYAGPEPSANDCYSRMEEDPRGTWVELSEWETLYKRVQELEASLRWAIDYGSWEDLLDGNPLMKQAFDRACELVRPERSGRQKALDKDMKEAVEYIQGKKKKLTRFTKSRTKR